MTRLGRVDEAGCSGLSSAPGLLQRSVLSEYQETCWDEMPSALLLGQPLFAIRGSLVPYWAPNVAGLRCMYTIYAPGGLVGKN